MKQPLITTVEAAPMLVGWTSSMLSEPCRLGVFRSARQAVPGGRWYLDAAEVEAWAPALMEDKRQLHRACEAARKGFPYAVPEYGKVPAAVILATPPDAVEDPPTPLVVGEAPPEPSGGVARPWLPTVLVRSAQHPTGDDISPLLWDLTQFPYVGRAQATDPYELGIRVYPNVRGAEMGSSTVHVLVNGKVQSGRMWQGLWSDAHLAGVVYALTQFTRYWALVKHDTPGRDAGLIITEFANWIAGEQLQAEFKITTE